MNEPLPSSGHGLPQSPPADEACRERRVFLAQAGIAALGSGLLLLGGCRETTQERSATVELQDPKIEMLALALQHEHGAIIQYANHAGLIKATGGSSPDDLDLYARIINDEARHAITLISLLQRQGVTPTMAVWPPQTAEGRLHGLRLDLEAETGAVKLYASMLQVNYEDRVKKLLEQMLHDEIEHEHVFQELIAA